jgi:anaerobic selenocysteine-containing dehydrogenase
VTTTASTFCRVCHASCPVDIDIADNRAIAVRGIPADPLFGGYTCIKGRQIPDQLADPGRLRAPLRRQPDGTFELANSADVLDEIAAKLRAIIDTHGPRSVASYTGTGGYQNSVAVPAARAFHVGIGSSSFYTSVTIDQPAKGTAPLRAGTWEAGYHDFSNADVLLAIGYNPMVSSYGPVGGLQGTDPFVVMRTAKANGLKLIVIDPRRTELAAMADIHLAVRPGEDSTLLASIINTVLAEDLFDHEFCDQWVGDLPALAASVAPFSVDHAAVRCGVDADDIVAAARMFAAGTRGTCGTGTGPNMAPHSSLTEHLSIVLNTICGRVNKGGERLESGWFLYPETPRRAQVIASRVPAKGPPARIRELRGFRGEMPTTTLAEEILLPGEGQIRALIVSGGNPAVAWPDQELTLRALQHLELLVVIDHRMSATAEFAHYVLAPTLALERADVPHLMDRWFRAPYTNYTPALLDRDGDVLNEWEVFWELARRLGSPLPFPGGDAPVDHHPTDDEIIDLAYSGSRMPLDEVRANRMQIHPDRAMVVQPADASCTARFTLAPDDLMSELASVHAHDDLTAVFGVAADDFPFRLVSRRLKHVLNSLGLELPALAKKGTTNPAYMNPDDLEELGLHSGELVTITSPRASLTAVVADAPDVRRGVISMAHSWGGSSLTDDKVRDIGSPTNRLVSTTAAYDPVTGMVVQSAIPVRVDRAPAPVADSQ